MGGANMPYFLKCVNFQFLPPYSLFYTFDIKLEQIYLTVISAVCHIYSKYLIKC
jgi:hypothetical protein